MAGYSVTARIDGVTPRVAPAPVASPPGSRRRTADAIDGDPVDLVGRPLEVVVAERWDAARERWAQATFFLFDPESWR